MEILWARASAPAADMQTRAGLPPRCNAKWFSSTFCDGAEISNVDAVWDAVESLKVYNPICLIAALHPEFVNAHMQATKVELYSALVATKLQNSNLCAFAWSHGGPNAQRGPRNASHTSPHLLSLSYALIICTRGCLCHVAPPCAQHRVVGLSQQSPGVVDAPGLRRTICQCILKAVCANQSDFALGVPPAISVTFKDEDQTAEKWQFQHGDEEQSFVSHGQKSRTEFTSMMLAARSVNGQSSQGSLLTIGTEAQSQSRQSSSRAGGQPQRQGSIKV
eukprot:4503461-Prymnesium_polylepis.2